MKAYKVFDENWKCRDFQYKVGETYELQGDPILCKIGFHACYNLAGCFNYKEFTSKNKVAEVKILGDFVGDVTDKIATNKIRIIREISWFEVLQKVNSGINNSGNRNSGHRTSGHRNSGDENSGDGNSGHRNSGDYNSGEFNAGSFNCSSFNNGVFNSKAPEFLYAFNKLLPRDEIEKIKCSKGFNVLNRFKLIKYRVRSETGKFGDYKYLTYKSSFRHFWRNLSLKERRSVIFMPHFDRDVFYEITGVRL